MYSNNSVVLLQEIFKKLLILTSDCQQAEKLNLQEQGANF